MKIRLTAWVALLPLLWLLGACTAASPQASADPDQAALPGRWQQFIPIDSMPNALEFHENGSMVVDGNEGRWQLSNGQLRIRTTGGQRNYGYTLSGYLLTLVDVDADTSAYYINPDLFARGADANDKLKGDWGAFDSYARLQFDGTGKVNDVVYTSAGETALERTYAAQDGILQSEDSDGSYTYNLFSFSDDGALLLAESSEFDNENKQWTAYWQVTGAPAGLVNVWKAALPVTDGEESGLPATLSLEAGGVGSVADKEGTVATVTWRYYAGGFVEWTTEGHDVSYAHCSLSGKVLYLNDADESQCWYTNANYAPTIQGLASFAGQWIADDGVTQLTVAQGGKLTFRNAQGKDVVADATAADGLIRVRYENADYYLYGEVQDGVFSLVFGDLPFWDGVEGNPLALTKAG